MQLSPAFRPHRQLFSVPALLALLPLFAGCGSTGPETAESSPYVPLPDPEPDSIGFFLTEFDASLRAWTNLKLAGRGERDERMRRTLEREMTQRARKRSEDLLQEFETGPPSNRAVAAVALGFTKDPAMMSPLYAALNDRESDVVHNALLGLGHLASPDTPPTELCYLLHNDPDPWIRSNAAYAISSVVAAGGETPDMLKRACREALIDEEPGVRAQCASTLGMAHDVASIEDLGDLLYDDVQLVGAAAASALSLIGRTEVESKGKSARLLAQALDRVDDKQREFLLDELALMSEIHHGDESVEWQEWAHKLP